jgi:hypothetical protein
MPHPKGNSSGVIRIKSPKLNKPVVSNTDELHKKEIKMKKIKTPAINDKNNTSSCDDKKHILSPKSFQPFLQNSGKGKQITDSKKINNQTSNNTSNETETLYHNIVVLPPKKQKKTELKCKMGSAYITKKLIRPSKKKKKSSFPITSFYQPNKQFVFPSLPRRDPISPKVLLINSSEFTNTNNSNVSLNPLTHDTTCSSNSPFDLFNNNYHNNNNTDDVRISNNNLNEIKNDTKKNYSPLLEQSSVSSDNESSCSSFDLNDLEL